MSKPIALIVLCITLVTIVALSLGAWLTSKGYQGGEIMLTTGASGLGGLIALLSSTRNTGTPGDPISTTVTNTPSQPVPTTESSK